MSLRPDVAHHALPGDAAIVIRPVGADDRDAIQAFVRSMSMASRRRRYFRPLRELSPEMLDALMPAASRAAFLAVTCDRADATVLGLAQCAADECSPDWEIALAVGDGTQGRGIGSALMRAMLHHLRGAGARRALGEVMCNNRAMLALALKWNFSVSTHRRDAGLLCIARSVASTAPGGAVGLVINPAAAAAADTGLRDRAAFLPGR